MLRIIYTLTFIISFLYIRLPMPIHAVSSCEIIEKDGPGYVYPADGPGCSDYEDLSENLNRLLTNADVHCLDKAEIEPILRGKRELIEQQDRRTGVVDGSLGARDNTNVALDNSLIESESASGSPLVHEQYGARFNVSMNDRLNGNILRHCAGKGLNIQDCAATIVNGILPSGGINDQVLTTPYQRSATIPEQIRNACQQALIINACNSSDTAGNQYLCGNNIRMTEAENGPVNAEIAGQMLGSLCKDFEAATDDELQYRYDHLGSEDVRVSYLTIAPMMAAEKFYIVVRPYCNVTPLLCGLFGLINPFPDPLIIEAFLPASHQSAAMIERDFMLTHTPEEYEQYINAAKASTGSFSGSSVKEKLLTKIQNSDDPECSKTYDYKQYMGAHAQSYGGDLETGNATTRIRQPFSIQDSLSNFFQSADKKFRVYKAWVVAPNSTRVIENLSKINAMRFLPPEEFNRMDPEKRENLITAPQSIVADAVDGNNHNAYDRTPRVCRDDEIGPCFTEGEEAYLEYSHSTSDTGLLGGQYQTNLTLFENGAFQPLQDLDGTPNPNNWWHHTSADQVMCYFDAYKRANPAVASSIEMDDIMGNASCGPPLSSSGSGPGQCTTDPSVYDAAISEAASKYGIPENFLRAIFQIEATGSIIGVDSSTYTCEPNSADALGAFQITGSTYRTVTCESERMEDVGICSDPGTDTLSRCDPTDAAQLSARVLLNKVGKWYGCTGSTGLTAPEFYRAACNYYGYAAATGTCIDDLTVRIGNQLGITNASYADIACHFAGIDCSGYILPGRADNM